MDRISKNASKKRKSKKKSKIKPTNDPELHASLSDSIYKDSFDKFLGDRGDRRKQLNLKTNVRASFNRDSSFEMSTTESDLTTNIIPINTINTVCSTPKFKFNNVVGTTDSTDLFASYGSDESPAITISQTNELIQLDLISAAQDDNTKDVDKEKLIRTINVTTTGLESFVSSKLSSLNKSDCASDVDEMPAHNGSTSSIQPFSANCSTQEESQFLKCLRKRLLDRRSDNVNFSDSVDSYKNIREIPKSANSTDNLQDISHSSDSMRTKLSLGQSNVENDRLESCIEISSEISCSLINTAFDVKLETDSTTSSSSSIRSLKEPNFRESESTDAQTGPCKTTKYLRRLRRTVIEKMKSVTNNHECPRTDQLKNSAYISPRVNLCSRFDVSVKSSDDQECEILGNALENYICNHKEPNEPSNQQDNDSSSMNSNSSQHHHHQHPSKRKSFELKQLASEVTSVDNIVNSQFVVTRKKPKFLVSCGDLSGGNGANTTESSNTSFSTSQCSSNHSNEDTQTSNQIETTNGILDSNSFSSDLESASVTSDLHHDSSGPYLTSVEECNDLIKAESENTSDSHHHSGGLHLTSVEECDDLTKAESENTSVTSDSHHHSNGLHLTSEEECNELTKADHPPSFADSELTTNTDDARTSEPVTSDSNLSPRVHLSDISNKINCDNVTKRKRNRLVKGLCLPAIIESSEYDLQEHENAKADTSSTKLGDQTTVMDTGLHPVTLTSGKWRRSLSFYRKHSISARSAYLLEQTDVESINSIKISLSNESNRQKLRHSVSFNLSRDNFAESIETFDRGAARRRRTSVINPTDVGRLTELSFRSTYEARDTILRKCGQSEPLEFENIYSEGALRHCRKIGEGVYGEVFMNKTDAGRAVVLKIIPIEGSQEVNGEPQKKFDEILSEIVIALQLSSLRNDKEYMTSSFAEVVQVRCVQGRYPNHLIDLWELYRDNYQTENDHPEIFNDDQLYIVFELANGGQDLEAFQFTNALQSKSTFQQIALALAIAEKKLFFEHRDLHWGNILLCPTDEKFVNFKFNGNTLQIPSEGIKVTIIDYTLSRMLYEGIVLYNDLSNDQELFTAHGDYQFDIYRLMKSNLENDWQRFEPFNNILWLHYIVDKLINGARYKNTKSRKHRLAIEELMVIRDEITNYKSAVESIL